MLFYEMSKIRSYNKENLEEEQVHQEPHSHSS